MAIYSWIRVVDFFLVVLRTVNSSEVTVSSAEFDYYGYLICKAVELICDELWIVWRWLLLLVLVSILGFAGILFGSGFEFAPILDNWAFSYLIWALLLVVFVGQPQSIGFVDLG